MYEDGGHSGANMGAGGIHNTLGGRDNRKRRQIERQMALGSRAHTPTPQNKTIKHKICQGGARTVRGVMGACLTWF